MVVNGRVQARKFQCGDKVVFASWLKLTCGSTGGTVVGINGDIVAVRPNEVYEKVVIINADNMKLLGEI